MTFGQRRELSQTWLSRSIPIAGWWTYFPAQMLLPFSAVSELSRTFKTSDAGDNVAARRHASAAQRLFTSAGIGAGALRARVEYLFSSHVAQEGNACMEATQSLGKGLEIRAYPWLKIQFHLEQGTCFWLLGDLGEARMLYRRAER